jgi:class 3 adenylate cyclase
VTQDGRRSIGSYTEAVTCPACGQAVQDDARFCPSCGAPLAPASTGRGTRRTVTVLFADVVGSTGLGERLDPEAVRSLMARHFASARGAIERHGGTVEKFIGDAVMAVFGIPRVHEDDALRAVRAAVELRDALEGSGLQVRIGLNTGEVVSGDGGETLVTGDTVNTAARLEQAAQPGEIILGPHTVELVRDAVSVDPMSMLDLKGKAAPVAAHRLRDLVGDVGRRRRLEGSIVGRERELARLLDTWRVASGQPRLVTILAAAGVGKSRLLREVGSALADEAQLLRGRCLPYGDGITYWPIRELAYELAGIGEADARAAALAKLGAALPGEPPEVARAVAAAIGLDPDPARQEEIFWAVRRTLEATARRGRLAVFVEDLHWAEHTMLDLLEYVLEMATAPMLIVATARPELLTARPGWGSGAGAELLRLEPLPADAAEALLLAQPGADGLPDGLRDRILNAAEGNALFLEEMVGMLRDRGSLSQEDGAWRLTAATSQTEVPPTVQALLAARLDELPSEERAVAEHGAVIGRSFEADAVSAIAPAGLQTDLARRLLSLVRKELLRPDRSLLTDGDAFSFRHILIRDAAYAALPKAERAVLHERFADWLVQVAGDRIGEFEEVVGYHLGQAVEYRRALGETGPEVDALAQRAAETLRSAGRRARLRYDYAAVASLLSRSTGLATVTDVELGRDLVYLRSAQVALGQLDAARRSVERIDQVVAVIDDVELRLRRDLLLYLMPAAEGSFLSDRRADAERVFREAEAANLPGVQASALVQLGVAELLAGRPMEEFRLLERAESYALRDPDPMVLRVVRLYIANRLPGLPMPVDEIERRLREQLELAVDVEVRAEAIIGLAFVAAAGGHTDDARSLAADVRRVAEEVGIRGFVRDSWAGTAASIELLCGAPDRGEAILREVYPEVLRLQDWWEVGQYAPQLAWMTAFQRDRLTEERAAEVAELVRVGRSIPDEKQPIETARGDQALALVASWRGDHDDAVRTAEAAAAAATSAGGSYEAAVALLVLATVLNAAGRAEAAHDAATRARETAASNGLRPLEHMAESMIQGS